MVNIKNFDLVSRWKLLYPMTYIFFNFQRGNMTSNSIIVEKRCTICTYTTRSFIELLRHSIEHENETVSAASTPISSHVTHLSSSTRTYTENVVVPVPRVPINCVSFKTIRDGAKSTRPRLIKQRKNKIRSALDLHKYKQEQYADFMKHVELYHSRRDFFLNPFFQSEQ